MRPVLIRQKAEKLTGGSTLAARKPTLLTALGWPASGGNQPSVLLLNSAIAHSAVSVTLLQPD